MPTIIDMHIHTTRGASDSGLNPDDLAREARQRGLNAIHVAEHDRLWDKFTLKEYRAKNPDLLVCNGMEISTELGHILALGLKEYVGGIRHARTLRKVADEHGAFLIVAHPFRHYFDPVYFRRQGKEPFTLTPEQAANLPVFQIVDAIEVLNGANVNFVVFSNPKYGVLGLDGHVFALFVIVMAAGEAAIALAILLNFYNNHSTVDVDRAEELLG